MGLNQKQKKTSKVKRQTLPKSAKKLSAPLEAPYCSAKTVLISLAAVAAASLKHYLFDFGKKGEQDFKINWCLSRLLLQPLSNANFVYWLILFVDIQWLLSISLHSPFHSYMWTSVKKSVSLSEFLWPQLQLCRLLQSSASSDAALVFLKICENKFIE